MAEHSERPFTLGLQLSTLFYQDAVKPILVADFPALAYSAARMHNALGVTDPLPAQVSNFHGRPYRVIHGDRFTDAIRNVIISREVRDLPAHLGGIDQFVHSGDLLEHLDRIAQPKAPYESAG